jgi:hypothetical protein
MGMSWRRSWSRVWRSSRLGWPRKLWFMVGVRVWPGICLLGLCSSEDEILRMIVSVSIDVAGCEVCCLEALSC